MSDQTPYLRIGWINDEGLWVVTAAQADALPEGSLIAPLGDERGRTRTAAATEPHDERPFQGRVRVGGRWVGPTTGLATDETYRVLHPASPTQVAGEVAMSRSQFETALARCRPDGVYERGIATRVAMLDVSPGRNKYGVP